MGAWAMTEMMMTKRNCRNLRYDFYRGMLIIGVVIGHIITALRQGGGGTPWIHVFVRTYDMPMFAFITGVFLKKSCDKHSVWTNLLNKTTTILLPTVLWNIIITRDFSFGCLWYLWSSYIASVGIIVIHWLTKKKPMIRPVFLILMILAFHMPHMTRYYVGFLAFPMVVGYYYDGVLEMLNNENKIFYYRIAVVITFVTLLCFWKPEYSIWNLGCEILGNNGNIMANVFKMLYRGIIGIMGSLTMKYLFDAIYDKTEASERMNCIVKGLESIGKYTMEIYILQTIIVEIYASKLYSILIAVIGFNPLIFNSDFLGWVVAPILAIVAVICCYYIQIWIKKTPIIGLFIFGTKASEWEKASIFNRKN